MSLRYCLSKFVEVGPPEFPFTQLVPEILTKTDPDLGGANAWPFTSSYNGSGSPQVGDLAIVLVSGPNPALAETNDDTTVMFPGEVPDAPLATVLGPAFGAMIASLATKGIAVATIASSNTVREVTEIVGQQIDPAFTFSKLTVRD